MAPQSPEPPESDPDAESTLDHALLGALFGQSPVGLHVLDPELRVLRVNTAARGMLGVDPAVVVGHRWSEVDPALGGINARVREVLATGEPMLEVPWTGRLFDADGGPRTLSVSAFRLSDRDGRVVGAAVTVVDITERRRAQQHIDLMLRAGQRLGGTLEVVPTAAELAQVAVEGLADLATVDVLESVLRGDAPAPGGLLDRAAVRRAGFARAEGREVEDIFPLGEVRLMRTGTPYAQALADLRPRVVRRLSMDEPWLLRDRDRSRQMLDAGVHSLLVAPLTARGVLLGLASYYRMAGSEPFDEADLAVAAELASRAAVCLDNARRYTRENTLASLVRRSLVPSRAPEQSAVEAAHAYLPVVSGGTWYDVVPLSSARVALVVGEVTGHGVPAATTLGRLRTALGTLADMDLAPDELLERLHELTGRLSDERAPVFADQPPLSATCLLAVYDPASAHCLLASAGHPGPLLRLPGEAPREVEVPAGPPLGRGRAAYPLTELDLPEGSLLALHNAGLATTAAARRTLLDRLADDEPADLQEAGDALVRAVLPEDPHDDALLLLARTRRLGPDRLASWTLPSERQSAAAARRLTGAQLTEWGLDGLAPTTKLIASELVTNAVRYANGSIGLRLIRDRGLICEISDSSSAAPHLRHAEDDDEGGRGLYLVAQLTGRWGARQGPRGKTIWTEQDLP